MTSPPLAVARLPRRRAARPVLHLVPAARLDDAVDRPGRLPPARQVLAETGKFTRFPDAPRVRARSHPHARVSDRSSRVLYRVFGVGQLPVALAQTVLFVAICLLVYAIARARRLRSASRSRAAAATALFPPIPYFGALVMTEVWTTLLFTLSMWVAVRARWQDARLRRSPALGVAARADDAEPAGVRAVSVRARRDRPDRACRCAARQPRPRRRRWAAMLGASSRSRCCRGSPTTT